MDTLSLCAGTAPGGAACATPTDETVRLVRDDNGLEYIEVRNRWAEARLALQGAHLTHWHPVHTAEPVLWVSGRSRYEAGRSIRGGIPLCWPWFGAHPTDSALCMHGFARVTPFALIDAGPTDDGGTRLVLEMQQTENAQRQLSYPYTLILTVEIGKTLTLHLSTTNRASQPFFMGEAFHAYFNVSDIGAIRISGLDGVEYADKLLNYTRGQQQGDISFSQEFDRVYVDTRSTVQIHDPRFKRRIDVRKTGSNSTVIWTPWEQKAHQMADMTPDDDWRHMVCVEAANAMENLVMINPGYRHVLTVEYEVAALG